MNHKFKMRQRVTALCMAAMMCCGMLPYGALAEDSARPVVVATPEQAATQEAKSESDANSTATPETADESPDEDAPQQEPETEGDTGGSDELYEIWHKMYPSLTQEPTGYYLDSYGLPVLVGETKISIEGWGNEDYSSVSDDSFQQVALDAALLDADSTTAAFPHMDGEDYAIVPISMQVMYPANGSSADITLPDNVELLGYSFTSGDLTPATEEERQSQLHYEFSEISASVAGIYVKASEDFSVTMTYTDATQTLTKIVHVTLDDSAPVPGILQDRFAQETQVAMCSADEGIATYAGLQVTQCVNTSVGWMNYLGGQPALCGDRGKWAWGPGATYKNKYPPVANYTPAGQVWVEAEYFNKGWVPDQATLWSKGFNNGAPAVASLALDAANNATDNIGNYKNRPRRVVFYGRVSTEHEEQLSALGNQMEWYTDLALRNPNWTVVAQYIDEGITGTQMKKRPSFMRMIEHAKEHRFDLIVTRELSRFARNTVDALNATRELKQYGVEVYFVNDGIWTMDGDGEVRLTIMASIAQDESRKTSERVKDGQKMSREKGVLYGSGNIIGYDRVDGTYVINEEQAATVRRIFNLYAEGHGETTVAKMLIEENRKDGGGGLSWTASKVSRVLRKPTYKGYMTYNKSHIDDFLSHNRINHSEEDFVLVKGNFEPIVSEELWETCNQIRSKRAAFVKGKDGRAHKFGVSFPQNKWTKILFCDCGMRFQIEGYDKTANGGKNMRLICARSKMFKKKDAARALNGIPCPAPYASEWKLELMAREVFRTVWKENAEDILGLLRMLDANLNTTGTPNDGNQLENKLSALNEELDDLVSQRASRSITMDDFLSRSTEINNEIINVEGLLQSSIQEQRPKARLDMHSIEAALSDDASFPDGKIEPGFLDRYASQIVKSNNRYIWMLQLMNVQQIMPIQSERQPIAMVTYKSGVPYDIEQEQIDKQDKESAGPDCATICRPQDFFLNMSRTKRKRKLVEWLESCQENQVSVLDEKIPLLSFAVDFVTAYEYQKARGIKIHPGLWKDMRVDIFLVKKEN